MMLARSRAHLHFMSWIVLLGLCVCMGGCRRKGEFPSQPITLLCPWSAGGGTDRVSRQMAAQLESELDIPVNVINAVGGSGVTGHSRGALARPDGYTLTMITVELNILHWRGLTNVTPKDFAPLVLLNRDSAALFVRTDSSYHTLDDLEAAIRRQPGRLKMSGTAQGGIWHLAAAGWLLERGLPATAANWISINGAGPSMQELTAGGLDFICCSLPEADALLSGGKVRCLGVMADERVPAYPDVPTFVEQGHEWSMAGWRGLAAPRETPPERLERLEAAAQQVATSPAFRKFMQQAGFNVSLEDAETFAETLRRQDELFRDILTSEAFASVGEERLGPMIFPSVIGGLLFICLLAIIVSSLSERGRNEQGGQADAAGLSSESRGHVIATLLAIVWYLLLVEHAGFLLTVFPMLAALMVRFRVNGLLAVGLSLVVSGLVYHVFGVLLRVPLPRGVFGW